MTENNNQNYEYSSYQPPVDSTNRVYVTPAPSYSADGSSNIPPRYDTPAQEQDVTGLAVGSIVCSLLAFCCCGVPAIVGLVLGISALGKKKGDALSIIGVVLNALVLGLIFIGFVLLSLGMAGAVNDPEMMEIIEEYGNYVAYTF